MAAELTMGTPVADALNNAVQLKLVDLGWASGGLDDAAPLAEYILLMLVNGKTQDQIASELANDLLSLGPEDTAATEFSQWLFSELNRLNMELNGGAAGNAQQEPQAISAMADQDMSGGMQDTAMEGQDGDVPTGPKAMRKNDRNQMGRGRMVGQINRALDRGNDSVLHRVRPQGGNERINQHGQNARSARGAHNRNNRMMGNRGAGMGMGGGMANGGAASSIINMNPQQQMQMMAAMLEEQSRMMAQFMPGMVSPAINPNFQNGQNGRSLMDRVQKNGRGGHQNGFNRNKGLNQNKKSQDVEMDMDTKPDTDPSSSMEFETSSQNAATADPAATMCRFNKRCKNKDCPFAHASPAAPEGTNVDVTDTCSYGAACKNFKCTARHPSPAQKAAHQSEESCRFYPNCTNPHCTFKHPSMPPCRNGGDCTTPGCKFTHLQTPCRFNPCLNRNCPFKHAEGQRGQFPDKVWTADGANKEHLSERKFMDESADGEEELIKPDAETAAAQEAALIT